MNRPGAIPKEKLSDSLARAVKRLIDSGGYETGDRLPTIAEMAGMFGVGAPTLREALKKLQGAGVVNIKHGAGIFVAENHDSLFVRNPLIERKPSKKVILDMIDARRAIETYAAGLAVDHATDQHIAEMHDLLDRAKGSMEEGDQPGLAAANMGFHREIAIASYNGVISQLLALITGLFQTEFYAVLEIYGRTDGDYKEHLGILDAIEKRNKELAVRRMRNHLDNIHVAIETYFNEKASSRN